MCHYMGGIDLLVCISALCKELGQPIMTCDLVIVIDQLGLSWGADGGLFCLASHKSFSINRANIY